MPTLRQTLHQAGLGRVAADIGSRALPSIRLTRGKRTGPTVGKLGGRPNLPKGTPWPGVEEGAPLSFIAQLDLAALPKLRNVPLPRTGSLFFFYDATNQPWGYDPADLDSAEVIYSRAPLSAHPPRAHHCDLEEEARFVTTPLIASIETTMPPLRGSVLRGLGLKEEELKAYYKMVDPLSRNAHRIGGHPDQIQGDIFLEAQLVSNGIYCGDGSGYEKGRRRGLLAGAADWHLLLQVDSDIHTPGGMCWGDTGRLFFLIRHDDLRRRRFEHIWVVLQCT
jgi:uncharacterized protein YwqG